MCMNSGELLLFQIMLMEKSQSNGISTCNSDGENGRVILKWSLFYLYLFIFYLLNKNVLFADTSVPNSPF